MASSSSWLKNSRKKVQRSRRSFASYNKKHLFELIILRKMLTYAKAILTVESMVGQFKATTKMNF